MPSLNGSNHHEWLGAGDFYGGIDLFRLVTYRKHEAAEAPDPEDHPLGDQPQGYRGE